MPILSTWSCWQPQLVVSTRRDENGAVTGLTSWFDFKGRREQAYQTTDNDVQGLTNLMNAMGNTGRASDFPDLLEKISDDAKDFAINANLSADSIEERRGFCFAALKNPLFFIGPFCAVRIFWDGLFSFWSCVDSSRGKTAMNRGNIELGSYVSKKAKHKSGR